MFEAEQDYIPITEANAENIYIHPELPDFVPADEIGINIKRVQALMRIGGIMWLSIKGMNEGETSSFTPMIVGFNKQGGAYAGKGGKKNIIDMQETDRTQFILDFGTHGLRWALGMIQLNNNEIIQNIRDNKKFGDVRSPKAWAYFLDQAVKDSINKIGTRQLVMELGWKDIVKSGLFYLWPIILHNVSLTPENYLQVYMILKGIDVFLENIYNNILRELPFGFRNSLFLGPQLDRALILQTVTRTSTLIRPLT